MLGPINGQALLVGRVELNKLVFVDVGGAGYFGQVDALVEFDDFEIGLIGDRIEVDAIGFRRQHHLRQGQQLGHVVAGFLRQWQVPVVGRQVELVVAFDGTADCAFACVVGGQGQQPVTVEHVVQTGQVIQCGHSGSLNVTPSVIETGLAQVEVAPGRRDELPQTDGLAA